LETSNLVKTYINFYETSLGNVCRARQIK